MYLYLELWTARPAWLALSTEERTQFMDSIGPAIGQLLDTEIELLGFALADSGALQGTAHTYMAAWRMPTRELAVMLEEAVAGSGWHDYFDQVNARGAVMDTPDALAHMIAAN